MSSAKTITGPSTIPLHLRGLPPWPPKRSVIDRANGTPNRPRNAEHAKAIAEAQARAEYLRETGATLRHGSGRQKFPARDSLRAAEEAL